MNHRRPAKLLIQGGLLPIAVAFLVAGCQNTPTQLRPAGYVQFDRPSPALSEAQVVSLLADRADRLDDGSREILDAILAQPEAFLDASPPAEILNQAEAVVTAAGRLPELAYMYRDANTRAQERGLAPPWNPRLARVLAQLGQVDAALAMAQAEVEQTPDRADAWYALASVLMQQASTSEPQILDQIEQALLRFVQLSPTEPAFDGTPVATLQSQIEQIRTIRSRAP
jgi:hypothetical protein